MGVNNATSPVGIPLLPVTAIFAVTAEPCVIVVGVGVMPKVVVVALKVAVFQLFTRFEMFTEPSPVAKS